MFSSDISADILSVFLNLSRRSPVATNRSKSTKTKADTVKKGNCEITEVSVSVWGRAVWKQQGPTPNTALRTAA